MLESSSGQPVGRIGPKKDIDLGNAERIIFRLRELAQTISTTESVTAGGFGQALTRVPGSSQVFQGGLIVYTRQAKKKLLNIPDELLDEGLVTPEITLEMARLTRQLFDTDYAAAVTGNAGPTSDEGSTSVGRVYWAVVDRDGNEEVSNFDFFGNRDAVRAKTVTDGLRVVRNFIDPLG